MSSDRSFMAGANSCGTDNIAQPSNAVPNTTSTATIKMAVADARHHVVGRLRRPHGLKGEVTVFPLTGEAARLFAAGSALRRMDLTGSLLGEAVVEQDVGLGGL